MCRRAWDGIVIFNIKYILISTTSILGIGTSRMSSFVGNIVVHET